MKDIKDYQDIIDLPRHISKTRKPMTLLNRAAQFAPFAALTGFGEEIKETARVTEKKITLDDTAKEIISIKLQIINDKIKDNVPFTFKYFVKDKSKQGGEYKTITKIVKRIDEVERKVYFIDKTSIHLNTIIDIKSEIFNSLDIL